LFYQQGDNAGLNTAALLFFFTYSVLWANMEALGQYYEWRPVFEKERDGQVRRVLFVWPWLVVVITGN